MTKQSFHSSSPPRGVRFDRPWKVNLIGQIICTGFVALLIWSGITAFYRQVSPVPLVAQPSASSRSSSPLTDRPAPTSRDLALLKRDTDALQQPLAMRLQPEPAIGGRSETAIATADQRAEKEAKRDRYGRVIRVKGVPWTGAMFDFRPIRPVRTRTMKTTAYSPDERSCGKWADGITASGKSVWMNGGRLAAADKKIPYGTILTIPGYNNGNPIQVWDRGGKIKGDRLDLLYPTHHRAKQWGVQDLPVVFWEFVEMD